MGLIHTCNLSGVKLFYYLTTPSKAQFQAFKKAPKLHALKLLYGRTP
jgi:hypothetical protein